LAAVPEVLVASDADWIHDDVDAALGSPTMTIRTVRHGYDVIPAVEERVPDLVVLDLDIGNMGGMATCMALRLEESGGRLPRVPVLMLLDRQADIFLARRSEADGWLVKPLDAIRLRKAASAVLAGGTYTEGELGQYTTPPEELERTI
jgi:DNA-binding response OmpR family regulator